MKRKPDPLIAALIARLPAEGQPFETDKQIAWLNMMAMAFGTVYGGDAASRLGANQPTAAPAKPAPAAPAPKREPSYPYVIDTKGYVRKTNATGKRVLPGEVDAEIYDLRGINGDLKTIVWADNSVGLNGQDLTITVAP